MQDDVVYRRGQWSVSRRLITTPRKDWKASEVKGVELSRLPLWSAVSVAASIALMVTGLRSILYWHEVAIAVALIAILLVAGGQIGVLRVSIEAMRGSETGQVFGPMCVLTRMRAAIREILEERE